LVGKRTFDYIVTFCRAGIREGQEELVSNQLGPLALFLGVYIIVPITLARFIVSASWLQIAIAYGVLLSGLGLISAGGRTIDEKVGWMLILGLFFAIPGIPILSFILRKLGVGG